ncbi:hypothetical protein SUDANB132_03816 [Streptomyces sp. enrichment culture]
MKSNGRAPTFLAMTGYEQVRTAIAAIAAIAGDPESADRVELTLPQTGGCGGAGLFDAPDTRQPETRQPDTRQPDTRPAEGGGGCCGRAVRGPGQHSGRCQ